MTYPLKISKISAVDELIKANGWLVQYSRAQRDGNNVCYFPVPGETDSAAVSVQTDLHNDPKSAACGGP